MKSWKNPDPYESPTVIDVGIAMIVLCSMVAPDPPKLTPSPKFSNGFHRAVSGRGGYQNLFDTRIGYDWHRGYQYAPMDMDMWFYCIWFRHVSNTLSLIARKVDLWAPQCMNDPDHGAGIQPLDLHRQVAERAVTPAVYPRTQGVASK